MFTGIVEEIGTVRHAAASVSGMRIEIASSRVVQDLGVDSSVSVSGASLTVSSLGKTYFEIALIPHTSERTTLGALRAGDLVNLETDVLAKYVLRLLAKG